MKRRILIPLAGLAIAACACASDPAPTGTLAPPTPTTAATTPTRMPPPTASPTLPPTSAPTASPTPTATPPPAPTAQLYVSADGEILRDACEDNDKPDHYDSTEIGIHTRGGETLHSTKELRAAGKNFHQVTTAEGLQGGAEMMVVDGYYYFRERSEEGVWTDWHVQPFPTPRTTLTPVPDQVSFCGIRWIGDEFAVSFVGAEVLDGVEVGRFRVSDPAWEEIGGHWRNDYWVDHDGQVRQIQHDFYDPDEGGSEERIIKTSTISGIGEPNEITAPEVTPNPGPTATP